LRWVGEDLPVGERQRGADLPACLCYEGGTAEHAKATLLHEATQRRDII
jgi:hypothetical protein